MKTWWLDIIHRKTKEVVRSFDLHTTSLRLAEKAQRGANINLEHRNYRVELNARTSVPPKAKAKYES